MANVSDQFIRDYKKEIFYCLVPIWARSKNLRNTHCPYTLSFVNFHFVDVSKLHLFDIL